jgi:apolipoprotein N-acyltransferase
VAHYDADLLRGLRPEFVRRIVRESSTHLLVTLANDAWFGDSQEPWMHLALARLRAVEHRRLLVRSTNSGVSAVVDPSGRILAQSGLFTRETLRATVHPLAGRTLYARLATGPPGSPPPWWHSPWLSGQEGSDE